MKVLKFGGSSVGSSEGMKQVKQIVGAEKQPIIVVVSAFSGVTNQLEEAALLASSKSNNYKDLLSSIRERHTTAVAEFSTTSEKNTALSIIESKLQELSSLIEGVFENGKLTDKIRDNVLCFGEQLSAIIISSSIKDAKYIDSGELIITDNNYGKAKVNYSFTNKCIQEVFAEMPKITVLPGFIAKDTHGNPTTIGRGGSDYSAAIFAAALDAESLEIWSDVDGFLTADPRRVSKAFTIESLSYAEAMELSHFGAKVVYAPTIQPTYKKQIPILIKNTFNPNAKGTLISNKSVAPVDDTPVKGVSSIDEIDLITIQGAGMVGAKGTSSRLFSALGAVDVNIILITQASSEYSITFAVSPKDTEIAVSAIEKEFDREIQIQNEINIVVEKELSIIAIVGGGMKNTPGISATLFNALGRNGISVIATAQGSSELNISIVTKRKSLRKALNVIHEGFFLSNYKELHIFMVGTGTVGSSLIQQIKHQYQYLLEDHKLKVNIVGISRSKKMVINPDGIDLDNYIEEIDKGQDADMKTYVKAIRELNMRNSVFVDCTADANVAGAYKDVIDSYVSVVTANKVACSSDYSLYKELKRTAVHNNVKFMFETNVGAGLPIISTINDLSRSGDKIIELQAVLSGTLNFLFNTLSEDIPLSKAIKMAQEMGYSEPDPRIDLSGIDVIRKLVILAREAGYPMEQKDVVVNSFLPADCFEGSLDDFWVKVAEHDAAFEAKRKELVEKGLKWRFIAELNRGKGSVGLETVDMLHPAYPLEGSNNILLLTTERYNEAPMVIRGYGAGADVTAAGVFADIIRVANV